jgi:hypothetical protein
MSVADPRYLQFLRIPQASTLLPRTIPATAGIAKPHRKLNT